MNHLSYDDIEAYADGALNAPEREADRTRILAHLDTCAACAGLARDLAAFAREVADEAAMLGPGGYAPLRDSGAAAAVASEADTGKPRDVKGEMPPYVELPVPTAGPVYRRRRLIFGFALSAAAVAVGCLLVAWLIVPHSGTSSQPRLAATPWSAPQAPGASFHRAPSLKTAGRPLPPSSQIAVAIRNSPDLRRAAPIRTIRTVPTSHVGQGTNASTNNSPVVRANRLRQPTYIGAAITAGRLPLPRVLSSLAILARTAHAGEEAVLRGEEAVVGAGHTEKTAHNFVPASVCVLPAPAVPEFRWALMPTTSSASPETAPSPPSPAPKSNTVAALEVWVASLDGEQVVLRSPPLAPRARVWRSATPLPAGQTLRWEVRAVDAGGHELSVSDPVFVATLSDGEVRALRRDLRRAAGNPLVRGIVYAHAGLLTQAQRELSHARRATSLVPKQRARAVELLALLSRKTGTPSAPAFEGVAKPK